MRADAHNGDDAVRLSQRRSPDAQPHDPRCPLHLKRLCGTCEHYGGKLRPLRRDPKRAPCAAFDTTRGRLDPAASCKHWTRKGAKP